MNHRLPIIICPPCHKQNQVPVCDRQITRIKSSHILEIKTPNSQDFGIRATVDIEILYSVVFPDTHEIVTIALVTLEHPDRKTPAAKPATSSATAERWKFRRIFADFMISQNFGLCDSRFAHCTAFFTESESRKLFMAGFE